MRQSALDSRVSIINLLLVDEKVYPLRGYKSSLTLEWIHRLTDFLTIEWDLPITHISIIYFSRNEECHQKLYGAFKSGSEKVE